ncbi:hypothetical protein BC833DRAFT_589359 [Globomyces pollinis-pini]|nr:hypothetical protein BC833DRAFT_589359 [Globomyces pollinis-pini]
MPKSTTEELQTLREQEEVRKLSHSALERKRRQRIKDQVFLLKSLLPNFPKEQSEKLMVLQSTVEYIKKVQQFLDELKSSHPDIDPSPFLPTTKNIRPQLNDLLPSYKPPPQYSSTFETITKSSGRTVHSFNPYGSSVGSSHRSYTAPKPVHSIPSSPVSNSLQNTNSSSNYISSNVTAVQPGHPALITSSQTGYTNLYNNRLPTVTGTYLYNPSINSGPASSVTVNDYTKKASNLDNKQPNTLRVSRLPLSPQSTTGSSAAGNQNSNNSLSSRNPMRLDNLLS